MALKTSNSCILDFQSEEEAWYSVRLVLQGETLIVKYRDFSDAYDESFKAADFKNPKELEKFIARFRPTAVQLQDKECKKVIEGMTVCASYTFGINDVRFYDAVVEEVNFKDHKFVKDEECTCTFMLFWVSGPNAGNKTDSVVAQICLLQSGNAQMDQTLSLFLEICREKHKAAPHSSGFVSEGDILRCDISTSHSGATGSISSNKSRSPLIESHARSSKEAKTYKHSVSTARKSKGRSTDHHEKTGQNVDLGGNAGLVKYPREMSGFCFMLIENLETDLSSSAIVNFVKKHISVTSQAQVFPSLSSESYTRGIIIVDSQEKLQKLSDFLHNPDHVILSSKGRPWVVTEKKFWHGVLGAKFEDLTMLPESLPWDRSLEIDEKIRIVNSGNEEYERGKQFKNLFLEFADHQRCLHHTLALEERKILQTRNV